MLVHKDVFDDVLARVTERARSIVIGDPLDPATELGPLAIRAQLDKVQRYVAIGAGEDAARLVTGGRQPAIAAETGGWYFEPTIFTDVTNEMRVAREEIFGPVAAFIPFSDEDEALRIANDTPYGLAAGAAGRAEISGGRTGWPGGSTPASSGSNTYRAMAPQIPFGGVEESGLGRENSYVLREYTRTKSVWVNTSDAPEWATRSCSVERCIRIRHLSGSRAASEGHDGDDPDRRPGPIRGSTTTAT